MPRPAYRWEKAITWRFLGNTGRRQSPPSLSGQGATVFCHYLLAHQPMRSADLMGYLYILATCQAEYSFSPCLAYDVAFRKKAARFRLTSWGQIDHNCILRPLLGQERPNPSLV